MNPRGRSSVLSGDIHNGGLGRDPFPLMIVPQAQVTDGMTALNARIGPVIWVVRTHTEPHQLISAVSEQLRQASGGFPVARVRSMDEVVVHSTARESFNMLLLSIFGASALVLASIGIYGLMAYSVQQRTQEMGIRMALGADRGRIRNLVVWQGMQLTIAGVIVGSRRGVWAYPPDRQLPLWREDVGPDCICNCSCSTGGGRAAGGMAACHARLQAGPYGGVAGGVD